MSFGNPDIDGEYRKLINLKTVSNYFLTVLNKVIR